MLNPGSYIVKCEKCGKYFKAGKYIYRINFDTLDVEDFRPWARLGVDLCFQCNKAVEEFVFGKPEEDKELSKEEVELIRASRRYNSEKL